VYFEYICQKFAGRLLDCVNTPLLRECDSSCCCSSCSSCCCCGFSHCMQQILESIHYCHQMNVVHRDMKVSHPLIFSAYVVMQQGCKKTWVFQRPNPVGFLGFVGFCIFWLNQFL